MRNYGSLALLLLLSGICRGTTLYDNSSFDTGDTLFFSVGPYTAIGDAIQLAQAGRADTATVQFYNNGGTGTFNAVLRFFEASGSAASPLGAQIGSDFSITGVSAPSGSSFNAAFETAGLVLPTDVIFTLSITQGTGVDLGLNLFDPPTVGSSSDAFLIVGKATTYAEIGTANNDANLFLTLSTVPEPGLLGYVGIGMVALSVAFRLRRAMVKQGAPRE